MGWFRKKGSCSICGQPGKEISDGFLCASCSRKAEITGDPRTYTTAQVKKKIESATRKKERRERLQTLFKATDSAAHYLIVDQEHGLFIIPSHSEEIYRFNQITGIEFICDEDAKVKGGIGRALIGGAIMDPLPAYLGSVAGIRRVDVCHMMQIVIGLDDIDQPVARIDLIDSVKKMSSGRVRLALEWARKIIDLVDWMAANAHVYSYEKSEADIALEEEADDLEENLSWEDIDIEREDALAEVEDLLQDEDLTPAEIRGWLEDDYEAEVIDYVIEHCQCDWSWRAYQIAHDYMESSCCSPQSLRDALRVDGFSEAQINEMFARHWDELALKEAKSLIEEYGFFDQDLFDRMKEEGYQDEQIEMIFSRLDWNTIISDYASEQAKYSDMAASVFAQMLQNTGFSATLVRSFMERDTIDWNAHALRKAKHIHTFAVCSKAQLKDMLISEGFEESQADYAVDHSDIDWKAEALKKAREIYDSWSQCTSAQMRVYLQHQSFQEEEIAYALAHLGIKRLPAPR